MGAIATGGLLVLDQQLIQMLGIDRSELERAVTAELRELERREAADRGERAPPDLTGKTSDEEVRELLARAAQPSEPPT